MKNPFQSQTAAAFLALPSDVATRKTTAASRKRVSALLLSVTVFSAVSTDASAEAYRYTLLDALGEGPSYAGDINDAGQVIGGSFRGKLPIGVVGPLPTFQAIFWNGTSPTELSTLGGRGSAAAGINNAGQVVGHSSTKGGEYHATLWNGTALTDLGTLGGDSSVAYSINDAGQVVGESDIDDTQSRHATLWIGAVPTDLNSVLDPGTLSAGWFLCSASAINDSGSIVGTACNSTVGVAQAFLMTPVPELGTYALMLAGLGALGVPARRRERSADGGSTE